jgi:CBS domain-containing protein
MVARADVLFWRRNGWTAGAILRDALAGRDVVSGYDDELVGQLADRMAVAGAGRVPILRRGDDRVVGLVARRDLLRVRMHVRRSEHEREILLRAWGRSKLAG